MCPIVKTAHGESAPRPQGWQERGVLRALYEIEEMAAGCRGRADDAGKRRQRLSGAQLAGYSTTSVPLSMRMPQVKPSSFLSAGMVIATSVGFSVSSTNLRSSGRSSSWPHSPDSLL